MVAMAEKNREGQVLCGVKIGEHSLDPEGVFEELRQRILEPGCTAVYIRPQSAGKQLSADDYLRIAEFLAEHQIYFFFGYKEQQKFMMADPEVLSQFDRETAEKLRAAGGKYFLGNATSEPGTATASNFAGYYRVFQTEQKTDCGDIREARDEFCSHVEKFARDNQELGIPGILCIEATALSKYSLAAGVDIPILEVMNGNPDEMLPSVRGAARSYGAPMWGVLIAHEWYGGMRQTDGLKKKRLELAWKYCYLAGADIMTLESGDEAVDSYGEKFGKDSEICAGYRKMVRDMAAFAREDIRPLGGPRVKVAFVSGRHDAWAGFCGSSCWNQFLREEWGYGPAEYSWRLLDELGTKRKWGDVANYGEADLSAGPGWGQYDIIPIESELEALCRYERLIFLGWNTMTGEDMDKLTEYVRRGGRLLMTAAHLNCNPQRKGALLLPPAEKVKALFGCGFTGRSVRTNSGTKFRRSSLDEELLYPGSDTFFCDPLYSAGYTEYLDTELAGAAPVGYLSDTFWGKQEDGFYTVLENRVGSGIATLVTASCYPGDPAVYPLYRALVRELVTASARNCPIRVIASDRLRWAVYEGDKVYLLNTDYDLPITVKLLRQEEEKLVTLQPLELRAEEMV